MDNPFTTDAVYLRIEPLLNEQGQWEGDLDMVTLIPSAFRMPTIDEYFNVTEMPTIAAACISLSNEDPEIFAKLQEHLEELQLEPSQERDAAVVGRKGNVVAVDFGNSEPDLGESQ